MKLKEKLAFEFVRKFDDPPPTDYVFLIHFNELNEAYIAGFEKARELAIESVSRNLGDNKYYCYEVLPLLGEDETVEEK